MTGSAADRPLLQPHIYSKATKKRLEKRFKDARTTRCKLVIVRDMWLTGFDAPACHTMYVDKPMRGHNLMQAIARVNRVFKDKPGGLVVDYIGIANELKQALKIYTDLARARGRRPFRPKRRCAMLLEKLDVVRGMFHGFDYSDYETKAHQMLVPGGQPYSRPATTARSASSMSWLAITKAFSLCSTLDEAAPLRKEIAFFSAIKAAIVKYTTVDKKRTRRRQELGPQADSR